MSGKSRNVQRVPTWKEAIAVSKAQGPETILRGLRLTIVGTGRKGEQSGRHGDTVRYAYYSGMDINGETNLLKWNGATGVDGQPMDLKKGDQIVVWESVWRSSQNLLSIGFGLSVGGKPGGLVFEGHDGGEVEPKPEPKPEIETSGTLEERVAELERAVAVHNSWARQVLAMLQS